MTDEDQPDSEDSDPLFETSFAVVDDIDRRRAALIVGSVAGVVAVCAALIGVAVLASPTFVVVNLMALVGGALILPAVWYLIGKELPLGLRTVAARILWTIAALIHGPYVAYWRSDWSVELVEARPEEEQIKVDGEWQHLDGGTWSRLGKTTFGVSWEKNEEALEGAAVDRENPSTALADGGVLPLGMRGGIPVATRYISDARNLVVDLTRVATRWRGAAGWAMGEAAKRDSLLDHGGTGQLSQKWLVIGILSSLLMGVISGWVIFYA